jgi:hypothetical protein
LTLQKGVGEQQWRLREGGEGKELWLKGEGGGKLWCFGQLLLRQRPEEEGGEGGGRKPDGKVLHFQHAFGGIRRTCSLSSAEHKCEAFPQMRGIPFNDAVHALHTHEGAGGVVIHLNHFECAAAETTLQTANAGISRLKVGQVAGGCYRSCAGAGGGGGWDIGS